jgi:hypothetical protein
VNSVNPTATLIDFAPIENTNVRQQTPELVIASQDVLLQGLGLLFDLGDRTYSRVVPAPYKASIGQHYRHILEHFQCLTRGLRSHEINYDARERNTTWRKARTLVARSQLVRDEDVRLAFLPLNSCWRGPLPFAPLDFEEYLELAAQVMAEHFPFEEAQRMLFRPLRNGRWFERRLVWVLGRIVRRQYDRAA